MGALNVQGMQDQDLTWDPLLLFICETYLIFLKVSWSLTLPRVIKILLLQNFTSPAKPVNTDFAILEDNNFS